MPAFVRAMLCLLAALGLGACAATGTPPHAPPGPFGTPPPPVQPPSLWAVWLFMAGLAAGSVLAGMWRRRGLKRALRLEGGRLLSGEVGRLRAVLAILEETALAAGRRGVVVRLRDWLRAKARGPGGRL